MDGAGAGLLDLVVYLRCEDKGGAGGGERWLEYQKNVWRQQQDLGK